MADLTYTKKARKRQEGPDGTKTVVVWHPVTVTALDAQAQQKEADALASTSNLHSPAHAHLGSSVNDDQLYVVPASFG